MPIRNLLLAAAILAVIPFAADAKRPNNKLNGIEIRNGQTPIIRSSSSDLSNILNRRSERVVVIPEMPTMILEWWMGPRVGTWPASQAGITPAVYADKGLREPMVGIPLSGHGPRDESLERVGNLLRQRGIPEEFARLSTEDLEQQLIQRGLSTTARNRILAPHNPQGWHLMGKRVIEEGWEAFDQYMVEFEALEPPIKTVWFWCWSGMDAYPLLPEGGGSTNPMGWPDINAMPESMALGWTQWREKWEQRGFKFGVWCSTPSFPNTGTWDNPIREWLKYKNEDGSTYVRPNDDPSAPADIDWFVDKMVELHQSSGFDYIGLDAANRLYELKDEPPHRDLNYLPAGYRERGITTALFTALATDARLDQCQFVTETHFPANNLHALLPTMFTVSGDAGPKAKMHEIDDEDHHILIPGCEVLAHMHGTVWTEQEWPSGAWPGPVYQELLDRGYTPTIDFPTLNERVLQPLRASGSLNTLPPPAAPSTTVDTGDSDAGAAKNGKKKKNKKKKKKRRKIRVKTWRR